ncbi:MAG: M15 family metallopeptidase [Candidatus Gastranaerophilales bacterium]|nr:M15 family metallopeptidase [Candidatus Gastranaerophilales bacterium]
MDYFEYLNKNRDNLNQPQSIEVNAGNTQDISDIDIYGNDFTVQQNDDGESIFNFATSEQLNEFDYNKIISTEADGQVEESPETKGDEKEDSLTTVLKDILSFEEVQKEADTDGDGKVSADEAKEYFLSLAGKDGDVGNLTSEDFDIFLKEKNIDLEQVYKTKTETQTVADTPQTSAPDEVSAPETPTSPEGSDTPDVAATPQASQSPKPVTIGRVGNTDIRLGSPSYYSGSRSSASAPVEKTIDNMSLEELQEEKTKREGTLTEKQKAVNAVHNGSNEKVAAAKVNAEAAKTAMETALNNDKNVKDSDTKDLMETISDIDAKDAELDENATSINDHEIEISNKEDSLKNLASNVKALTEGSSILDDKIATLKNELAGLSNSKDEKDIAKKNKLQSKIKDKEAELAGKKNDIATKQQEIKDTQGELNKLKQEKTDLEAKKAKLEEEKTKLEAKKTEIEAKIQKDCSPATKAKIKAYESAKQKIETVKAAELRTAQEAQTKAMEAVKEVNAKITEVSNRKLKSSSSLSILSVEDIPASVRKQLGGKVTQLPDGTEVLTFNYTKVDQMQPEMVEKIKEFQRIADEMGMTFVISDGTRSVAESNAARARKGTFVAAGGKSPHNYGVAIDIALYKDGKMVGGSEYTEYANRVKAEAHVDWGGDWGSYGKKYETQHFQLASWKRYKTSDNLIERHIT